MDFETEDKFRIQAVKMRQLESRLSTLESQNVENLQTINQLKKSLQEAGEFSLQLAHQIQLVANSVNSVE